MADLENPFLPGGGGDEDDDPTATTAEQDEESTLCHCLSIAFGSLLLTALFLFMLRFCHSHPTIMGIRALGVVAYGIAIAGIIFGGCGIVGVVPLFFCGNFFGEPQQDELPT